MTIWHLFLSLGAGLSGSGTTPTTRNVAVQWAGARYVILSPFDRLRAGFGKESTHAFWGRFLGCFALSEWRSEKAWRWVVRA